MATDRKPTVRERWEALQPSKTALVWACAGSVAAALIVGFTWGGWVTGGTAQQLAVSSGEQSYSQLASAICIEKFMAAPNARAQLVELKELDLSYKQRQFVESAGWATMPQAEKADRTAADLCAKALASMELNALAAEAEAVAEPASAVQ
ncbi:MAG TPA: hypothetical protein VHG92_07010 [Afifellaceae bacterium]|nr:hypothetical protein [Afifellaceae bacterium]